MLVFQNSGGTAHAEIKGGQLTAMRQRDEDNKTRVHVAPSYTMASDYRVPTKMASTSPGRSEGFSNANGTGESYSGVTAV